MRGAGPKNCGRPVFARSIDFFQGLSAPWRMRFPFFVRTTACLFLALLPFSLVARENLAVGWTNNMLTISSPDMPGGAIAINYLEAFCRSGSTQQKWEKTIIPHRTELLELVKPGRHLRLRSRVEGGVEVTHDIHSHGDYVELNLVATNSSDQAVDVQWFQPCMRVDRFTGLKQENYFSKCFIVTAQGISWLDHLPRNEEAIYHGGQVYVPAGVNTNDVNPRPLSATRPVNGLIGAVSFDGRYVLGNAWDSTQELFPGVIVCVHNDPRIGGLQPHQTKKLRGRIYLMQSTPEKLVKRYERDFKPARR